MCGYCTELYALYAVTADRSDELTRLRCSRDFGRALMLQEVQDYRALVDGFETPPGTAEALVWLGRALKNLTRHGFDSPDYQALLAMPRFRTAVDRCCGHTHAQGSPPEVSPLDVAALRWLTERETWLAPGVFARRMGDVSMACCASLLTRYSTLCLDVQNQSAAEPLADSVTSMTSHEFEYRGQFARWLLPLMLAITRIAEASCPDQTMRETLLPVLKNAPIGMPDPVANDLWLQRQAAVALYDRFGIAPFADNLYWLRSELFQYLALTGRIDARERGRLLEAFLQHGTRGDGNFFSLHHWLVKDDLLQSLTSFSQ